MMTASTRVTLQNELLQWYHTVKRDLPFRRTKNPYMIWLSEVMLQQTTIKSMLPYFERFLNRFPDIKSVAESDINDLLKLWQGLGYYSRARNFHKACQSLADNNYQLPTQASQWLELPGVGSYTAHAIASICYNEPVAVLDGNVKRVLARFFSFKDCIDTNKATQELQKLANEFMNPHHCGEHNQAIMELGSLICTPKNPNCPNCPLQNFCKSKNENPKTLPITKKMLYIDVSWGVLILRYKNTILLQSPHDKSLIRDMYEFPLAYQKNAGEWDWSNQTLNNLPHKPSKTGSLRHAITNKRILIHVYIYNLDDKIYKNLTKTLTNGLIWIYEDDLGQFTINTISKKIIKRFL